MVKHPAPENRPSPNGKAVASAWTTSTLVPARRSARLAARAASLSTAVRRTTRLASTSVVTPGPAPTSSTSSPKSCSPIAHGSRSFSTSAAHWARAAHQVSLVHTTMVLRATRPQVRGFGAASVKPRAAAQGGEQHPSPTGGTPEAGRARRRVPTPVRAVGGPLEVGRSRLWTCLPPLSTTVITHPLIPARQARRSTEWGWRTMSPASLSSALPDRPGRGEETPSPGPVDQQPACCAKVAP